MATRNSERLPNVTPQSSRKWAPATTWPETSSPSTARSLTSRTLLTTFRTCRRMSSLSMSAWALATPRSNRTRTAIGSSTTRGRTGFTRFMNCRSRAASRIISVRPPTPSRTARVGALQSIVPGPGPSGEQQKPQVVGDNPNLPRDPDKFDADNGFDAQREFRERGVPSGLANEIFLDVYERPASFEPQVRNLQQRLFDAYAAEVRRSAGNDDGIITALQGDIDTPTDGFADNARLYLPPTVFNRFAVTREINDGLLAPRFAPSQRAWVLSGVQVPVNPPVNASTGRDADDR